MFYRKKHDIKRGDVVTLKTIKQKMEVTYVSRGFMHDNISIIYQKKDGSMVSLGGFHPDSLVVVSNAKPRKKKAMNVTKQQQEKKGQ